MGKFMRGLAVVMSGAVLVLSGCGDDSSSPPPVAGPGAISGINMTGGSSTEGDGGDGYHLYINSRGNLNLSKTGTVDASFTMPVFTPDYGAVPYTVSADLTVELDGDTSVGGLCTVSGVQMNRFLYVTDNDGVCASGPPVTGLLVAANATLTLPEATSQSGIDNMAWYELNDDLVVYGTIRTVNDSRFLSFELTGSGSIYVGDTGVITVVPLAAGALGGELSLYTYNGGDVFILGSVLAGGSAPGGSAGPGSNDGIDIYVDYNETGSGDLYVSGAIRNDGADNPAGAGGNAAEVNLYSSNGMYFSDTAIVSAQGGAGNGGNGDSLYIIPGNDIADPADFVAGGQFLTSGGSATNGNGGRANYIYVRNSGTAPSNIRVNATSKAKGGTATGSGFSGGNGSSIEFYTNNGQIDIAGAIDSSGGDGPAGGGRAQVVGFGQAGGTSDINLFGFEAINISGGSGVNGGDAKYGGPGNDMDINAAGTITSDVDLYAIGGAGTVAGGAGGKILLNSGVRPSAVTGSYDVSGGIGGTSNGADGSFTVDP